MRRRRWLVGLIVAVALLTIDLTRAPGRQWTARVVLFAIDSYQAVLSPRMSGLGIQCRFEPTCSHYTEAAIRNRGLVPGVAHGARRIARCGPWTPLGTVDPPPGPIDQAESAPIAPNAEEPVAEEE